MQVVRCAHQMINLSSEFFIMILENGRSNMGFCVEYNLGGCLCKAGSSIGLTEALVQFQSVE